MNKIIRLYRDRNIYVSNSNIHGRGVFTDTDLFPGQIIEQAPVVHPKDKFSEYLDPNYQKYFFNWPCLKSNWRDLLNAKNSLDPQDIVHPVCVLGYGMMYNHSEDPNVVFECDTENDIIEFRAFKKICVGEELLICYSKDVKFKDE